MDIEQHIRQMYDAFEFSQLPPNEQERLTRERRMTDELVARFKHDLVAVLSKRDIDELYARLNPTLSLFDNRFALMTIDYYHAHFWLSYGSVKPDMWTIEHTGLVRRCPQTTHGTTDRVVAPDEFGDTFLLTLGAIQASAPAAAEQKRKAEQERATVEAAARDKMWLDRLAAIEQQCRTIDASDLSGRLIDIYNLLVDQQTATKKQRKKRRKMLDLLLGS